MADSPALLVELDRERFRSGDTVTGAVILRVQSGAPLRVRLGFCGAHFPEQIVAETDFHDRFFEKGTCREFVLHLPPNAPMTVEDREPSVTWFVEADLGESFSPERRAVTVEPAVCSAAEEGPNLPAYRLRNPVAKWLEYLVLGPLVVALALVALVAVVPVLVVVFAFGFPFEWTRRDALRRLRFELPERALFLGEWVPFEVVFQPHDLMDLRRLDLEIEGRERIPDGANTTDDPVFFRNRKTLIEDVVLQNERGDDGRVEIDGGFRIPENAATSIRGWITYTAKLRFVFPGRQDVRERRTLIVGSARLVSDRNVEPETEVSYRGIRLLEGEEAEGAQETDPEGRPPLTVAAMALYYLGLPLVGVELVRVLFSEAVSSLLLFGLLCWGAGAVGIWIQSRRREISNGRPA